VLLELPAGRLLVLAAVVGVLSAASLFNWSFVIGGHAFWRFPKGTVTGSMYDMAQVLTAYFYYVQSPWHVPLFYVSALGMPSGTNIILMDAVPVVALAGKLICGITGTMPNLFGAYFFLCFALPGVMITLVLIAANHSVRFSGNYRRGLCQYYARLIMAVGATSPLKPISADRRARALPILIAQKQLV